MKKDETIIYGIPFPDELSKLKGMSPIIIKSPYHIDYIYSYGQDSPFFAGLANKKLLGTKCPECGYSYATPKAYCMYCGTSCDWIELPAKGKVHTYTTCYYGGESFLDETPFNLVLVEFEGLDTLFLSRLTGVKAEEIQIGMQVKPQFAKLPRISPTDVWFVPVRK